MAADRDEKTEAPTPRRRSEARANGQVARSQDLTAAVLMTTAFLALYVFGPRLWLSMIALVAAFLSCEAPLKIDEILNLGTLGLIEIARRLAPFLIVIFFAIILTLYSQIGMLFTFKPLIPSLSKINPLSGLQRLFSVRSVMMAVISFGKLLVVGVLAYFTLVGGSTAIMYSFAMEHEGIFKLGSALMFELGMKLAIALIILALLDFAWQKYKHERDLKMTKEEVKDEFRSMEGDPKIKQRRRQVQLQIAMQRLQQDVPQADVIVTNPTHIAIAIKYDAESMPAPRVVAKGGDYIALRIRQIGKDYGIPIVEKKPLARAMYETVEPGDYIPERFYRAIAEILAFVYELSGKADSTRRQVAKAV